MYFFWKVISLASQASRKNDMHFLSGQINRRRQNFQTTIFCLGLRSKTQQRVVYF